MRVKTSCHHSAGLVTLNVPCVNNRLLSLQMRWKTDVIFLYWVCLVSSVSSKCHLETRKEHVFETSETFICIRMMFSCLHQNGKKMGKQTSFIKSLKKISINEILTCFLNFSFVRLTWIIKWTDNTQTFLVLWFNVNKTVLLVSFGFGTKNSKLCHSRGKNHILVNLTPVTCHHKVSWETYRHIETHRKADYCFYTLFFMQKYNQTRFNVWIGECLRCW